MNVYILDADMNRYQILVPIQENAWDEFQQFDGTPIDKPWTPVEMEVFRDDNFNKNLPSSDFPALTKHIPVFSNRAVKALEDILNENGELLPLNCAEGEYAAFNVTCMLDALDIEHSDLEFFKSSGRIMHVLKYEFLKDRLANYSIFKLPQLPLMRVFVTDKFVERVQEANLTGFDFRLIWSD